MGSDISNDGKPSAAPPAAIDKAPRGADPLTRILLVGGAAAGPLYVGAALIQGVTREGFDLGRHAISLLSNGDLGWIQIANFLLSGLLVTAGAIGIRRTLRPGRGRTWGPLLLGVYGLGLIGAGFFVADPAFGFPPGTPPGAPEAMTTAGLLHFVSAGIGFLAFSAACIGFARRFAAGGQRGWAAFSLAAGLAFLAGFFGVAAGSGQPWSVLGFWIALALAWGWLSAMAVRLMAERRGARA